MRERARNFILMRDGGDDVSVTRGSLSGKVAVEAARLVARVPDREGVGDAGLVSSCWWFSGDYILSGGYSSAIS